MRLHQGTPNTKACCSLLQLSMARLLQSPDLSLLERALADVVPKTLFNEVSGCRPKMISMLAHCSST